MRDMGRIWVDTEPREITLSELGRIQVNLIQHLGRLFDEHLFAFKSAAPETEKLLLEMLSDIEKEVARQNNQRFTIAFCGMVKAGCVTAFLGFENGNKPHNTCCQKIPFS
jgi:hypothetical protein